MSAKSFFLNYYCFMKATHKHINVLSIEETRQVAPVLKEIEVTIAEWLNEWIDSRGEQVFDYSTDYDGGSNGENLIDEYRDEFAQSGEVNRLAKKILNIADRGLDVMLVTFGNCYCALPEDISKAIKYTMVDSDDPAIELLIHLNDETSVWLIAHLGLVNYDGCFVSLRTARHPIKQVFLSPEAFSIEVFS